MPEIIFEKSRRNLKRIYNRIRQTSPADFLNKKPVLFLAIGGYNRTYGLLLEMGLEPNDIAVFSELRLSNEFIEETHGKRVVYINRINYVTNSRQGTDWSRRKLDLKVADEFEESMLIYQKANRTKGRGKSSAPWMKPNVVILDDPALNLQFDGHRFRYQKNLGFVQMTSRNAEPTKVLKEISQVEPAEHMSFALYQTQALNEEEVLQALGKLQTMADRTYEGKDYFKPTEFKKIVGSSEMFQYFKETDVFGVTQYDANKRIGSEVARWVVVPHEAYEFEGYVFKDEEDLYLEEIQQEEELEREVERMQQERLDKLLDEEINLNLRIGYFSNQLGNSGKETLRTFIDSIDTANESTGAVKSLARATTDEAYKEIKKNEVIYFIDGIYKDDERLDKNYMGGKKLISIDIDDGDYTRDEIESKLEAHGYFGLVYPTTKHYYDGSLRWRIILLADLEMTKNTYKHTVEGVARLLGIEIDKASTKLSQLVGYPFKKDDLSVVIGSKVSVAQFQPKQQDDNKVFDLQPRLAKKSLLDYNHKQAEDLKRALEEGIPEGERNETYYGIVKYLDDTLANPSYQANHEEALALKDQIKDQMRADGLPEKEIETLCNR